MATGSNKVRGASHWGAFTAQVEAGQLVGVQPFEGDPHPTELLETLPSAVHARCRVEQPMVRERWLVEGPGANGQARGVDPFVPVTWERALDLVASELLRVKSAYGNAAIYASSGWGSAGDFHSARSQLTRFLNGFGGFVDQVTNFSFGAASVILPRIVGSMAPVVGPVNTWPTIAKHTKLMVLFGGMPPKNSRINQGGVGSHDIADWQAKARAAGTEFVSISPVRDDTAAALGARWIPIRPNTDMALMLGLAHALWQDDRHDREFLKRYCTGFERFEAYLNGSADGQAKDVKWAASITEIPERTICELAHQMAVSRTLISASWSIQRAHHGEQPYWMVVTLAAMLGQIGLPGGGFGFGYGAMHGIGAARHSIAAATLPKGENQVTCTIPVARFCDMLLNPGGSYRFDGEDRTYPDIHLVYWCGGNAFHKLQDLNRVLRAWSRPETIIVHEPWWTPAARRADIVLPCTTSLERNDLAVSNSDRYVLANHKAIEPVAQARNEYEIYTELSARLGFKELFTEARDEMDWLHHLYNTFRQRAALKRVEMPSFDVFWKTGFVELPVPEEPPIPFADFRADHIRAPLDTPSGKFEIYSDTIASFAHADFPGHPVWMEPAEWLGGKSASRHPLHMISNQPRARLHSQLDCGEVSRRAKVSGREGMRINCVDAAARGINNADVVRVFNDRGQVLAGAIVTDDIRPGVIELATGAWFDPVDPAEPGSLDKHGNPNVLTLDIATSELGQCCAAQTALVEVVRYDEPLPAITAFDPPAVLVP